MTGPWTIIGDLNETLYASEVSGGSFCLSRATLLHNMLVACDLMDLGSVGGFFTWRKNGICGMHVRKRLDRCLAVLSGASFFLMP